MPRRPHRAPATGGNGWSSWVAAGPPHVHGRSAIVRRAIGSRCGVRPRRGGARRDPGARRLLHGGETRSAGPSAVRRAVLPRLTSVRCRLQPVRLAGGIRRRRLRRPPGHPSVARALRRPVAARGKCVRGEAPLGAAHGDRARAGAGAGIVVEGIDQWRLVTECLTAAGGER